jgi:hypothetical protein
MKIWIRRTLGVLTIGGSFAGIGMCLAALVQSPPLFQVFVLIVFTLVYAWGICAGVELFENSPYALISNRNFWCIQIPILHTNFFSYVFFCGGFLQVSLKFNPAEYGFQFTIFSSQFSLQFGTTPGESPAIGVNLLATAIVVFLAMKIRELSEAEALAAPSETLVT